MLYTVRVYKQDPIHGPQVLLSKTCGTPAGARLALRRAMREASQWFPPEHCDSWPEALARVVALEPSGSRSAASTFERGIAVSCTVSRAH